MAPEIKETEMKQLNNMRKIIEEIDRLTNELAEIGKGLPVIEKNALGIQSFIHVLRFGISDIAEILESYTSIPTGSSILSYEPVSPCIKPMPMERNLTTNIVAVKELRQIIGHFEGKYQCSLETFERKLENLEVPEHPGWEESIEWRNAVEQLDRLEL